MYDQESFKDELQRVMRKQHESSKNDLVMFHGSRIQVLDLITIIKNKAIEAAEKGEDVVRIRGLTKETGTKMMHFMRLYDLQCNLSPDYGQIPSGYQLNINWK